MASPQIAVRLDPETYKAVLTLARMEDKTISEFARELIEQGLSKHTSADQNLLDEVRMMRMELGDLMSRALKVGGITGYYARLAAIYAQEAMHFTVNEGEAMNSNAKKELAQKWRKEAREQALGMMQAKFEEI